MKHIVTLFLNLFFSFLKIWLVHSRWSGLNCEKASTIYEIASQDQVGGGGNEAEQTAAIIPT